MKLFPPTLDLIKSALQKENCQFYGDKFRNEQETLSYSLDDQFEQQFLQNFCSLFIRLVVCLTVGFSFCSLKATLENVFPFVCKLLRNFSSDMRGLNRQAFNPTQRKQNWALEVSTIVLVCYANIHIRRITALRKLLLSPTNQLSDDIIDLKFNRQNPEWCDSRESSRPFHRKLRSEVEIFCDYIEMIAQVVGRR